MTIAVGSAAGAAYTAPNGSSAAPDYPTAISAGDLLVLSAGSKPTVANTGSASAPGWTLVGQMIGAGGYGSTLANGTGNTNGWLWVKVADGTETGTSAIVNFTNNNIGWARIDRFTKTAAWWEFPTFYTGEQTATVAGPDMTVSTSTAIPLQPADRIVALFVMAYGSTGSNFPTNTMSAPGLTFGFCTNMSGMNTTNGFDVGGASPTAAVSAGSASGTQVVTWTSTLASTPQSNFRGPFLVMRLRETSVGPDERVSAVELLRSAGDLYGPPTQNVSAIEMLVASSKKTDLTVWSSGAEVPANTFVWKGGVEKPANIEWFPPSVVAPPDFVAPGKVTSLRTTDVGDYNIDLAWTNPIDPDLSQIVVRRAKGLVAPATISAGTNVPLATSTATSVSDTGLEWSTAYSYTVFTKDAANNIGAGASITVSTNFNGYGVHPSTALTVLSAANNPYPANTFTSTEYRINTSGTFTGWRFNHRVEIFSGTVTFIDCYFAGAASDTVSSGKALVNTRASGGGSSNFISCTFNPTATYVGLDCAHGANYTIDACELTRTVDGVRGEAPGNITVKNSWLHDFTLFPNDPNQGGGPTHNDCIQFHVGTGFLIENNLMTGTSENAAIIITQSPLISDITIVGNTFDLTRGASDINIYDAQGTGPIHPLIITGNRFKKEPTRYQMIISNRTWLQNPPKPGKPVPTTNPPDNNVSWNTWLDGTSDGLWVTPGG